MGIVAGSLHDSLSPCPPLSTHSFMESPPLTVNWTYSFLKHGLQEKQWGVTSDIIKRPRILSWAFPRYPLGGWPWGRPTGVSLEVDLLRNAKPHAGGVDTDSSAWSSLGDCSRARRLTAAPERPRTRGIQLCHVHIPDPQNCEIIVPVVLSR